MVPNKPVVARRPNKPVVASKAGYDGFIFIIVVLKKVPMYACKVASIISQDIVRWHLATKNMDVYMNG